jgi:hypothetical protein
VSVRPERRDTAASLHSAISGSSAYTANTGLTNGSVRGLLAPAAAAARGGAGAGGGRDEQGFSAVTSARPPSPARAPVIVPPLPLWQTGAPTAGAGGIAPVASGHGTTWTAGGISVAGAAMAREEPAWVRHGPPTGEL